MSDAQEYDQPGIDSADRLVVYGYGSTCDALQQCFHVVGSTRAMMASQDNPWLVCRG